MFPTAHQINSAKKYIKKRERIKVKPFFPPPNNSLTTAWEITVHDASKEEELWEDHKKTSDQSFYKKGLHSVGEKRGVDIKRFPTFFLEARLKKARGDNKLIGGVRMQLPDNNGMLSIFDELDGYTDTNALVNLIKQFEAESIVYGSGLWIAPKYNLPGLSADLARAYCLLVYMSEVRWHIGCAPYYILEAWAALGWKALSTVSGFPYPDNRYQSFILFGSKNTWPAPLLSWAKAQANHFDLNKLNQKAIVSPMRIGRKVS